MSAILQIRRMHKDVLRQTLIQAEEDLGIAMELERKNLRWVWGGKTIRELVVERLRRVQELRHDLMTREDDNA